MCSVCILCIISSVCVVHRGRSVSVVNMISMCSIVCGEGDGGSDSVCFITR